MLYLSGQVHRCIRLAGVLVGNFRKTGSNQFRLHAVACRTGVTREQGLDIRLLRHLRRHRATGYLCPCSRQCERCGLRGYRSPYGANQTVLLEDIAMGIARKVGEKRTQRDFCCTVRHARHVLHIALALHVPQGLIYRHTIAVRHAFLHIRYVLI